MPAAVSPQFFNEAAMNSSRRGGYKRYSEVRLCFFNEAAMNSSRRETMSPIAM